MACLYVYYIFVLFINKFHLYKGNCVEINWFLHMDILIYNNVKIADVYLCVDINICNLYIYFLNCFRKLVVYFNKNLIELFNIYFKDHPPLFENDVRN